MTPRSRAFYERTALAPRPLGSTARPPPASLSPSSVTLPRCRACSAPPTSSHQVELLSPVLRRAEIVERLMRSTIVVPVDPPADFTPRLSEVPELPDSH